MQSTICSTFPTTKSGLLSTRPQDLDILGDQRLLGIDRDDEEGISIQKPKSKRDTCGMPGRIHGGGPQPMNTLRRQNGLPHVRHNREAQASHKPTTPKSLNLETVRGNNICGLRPTTQNINEYADPPLAKRRKLENHNRTLPRDRSSSSASPAEDPLHRQSPERLIVRTSQDSSRTSSLSHRPSEVFSKPRQSIVQGVPELKRLEDMMHSGHRSKRHRKLQDRASSQIGNIYHSKSASPVQEIASGQAVEVISSDSDEIQEVGSIPRSKSTGGAYVLQNQANIHHRAHNHVSTPNQDSHISRYFHPSDTNAQFLGKRTSGQRGIRVEIPPPMDESLNERFVQVNGKRRGETAVPSSPDELTSETTVGRHGELQASSPNKRPRHERRNKESSTREQRPMVLESSQIKSTDFQGKTARKKVGGGTEAPAPWGVGVSVVHIPSEGTKVENDSMGLVYDGREKVYNIVVQNQPFHNPGVSSKIARDKLTRIWFEQDGTKLRFESSQAEGSDNKLDIELSQKEEVIRLLGHLQQDKALHCMGKNSDWMQRAFDRRCIEHRKWQARRNDQPSILQIKDSQSLVNGMSQQVWNQRMKAAKDEQPSQRTRIVGDLLQRARNDNKQSLPTAEPTLSEQDAVAENAPFRPKISSMVSKMNPQPQFRDPTLRRSTRASASSTAGDELIAAAFEEPTLSKYSRDVGFGARWKRPLTYPKTGKKKATVDWVDLEKLDEGEFLNDALVTFYMRYLEHEMEGTNPALAKRIYFFSTFFYERLTDFPRGKRQINYAAVQKWTKNVDLFTYDYVVVPVNQSAHWYLVIICNLHALKRTITLSDGKMASETKSDPPSSSPPPSRGSQVSIDRLVDACTEGPAEKGTRESFAELSLDNDGKHSSAASGKKDQSIQLNYDEDETLEIPCPLLAAIHEPGSDLINASHVNVINSPARDAEGKTKKPTSLKKQKRKSMPAVTYTDPASPLIMVFDSLGGQHPSTVRYLKDYLFLEAKAKRGDMEIDVGAIHGVNAKDVPLQSNFSDCGLYMLGYLEKFMHDGPDTFIRKTVKRDYQEEDWSNLEPNKMRTDLRNKIFELHDIQEGEHRAAKAEKKQRSEPVSSSPEKASSLEKVPIGQQQILAHSKTASSSRSTTPPLPTRNQALASALPLDVARSGKHDDRFTAGKGGDGPTHAAHTGNHPRELHGGVEEVSQGDESVILLESQNLGQLSAQRLSPEGAVSGHHAEKRALSPELPSQIEDSQGQEEKDGGQVSYRIP